MTDRLIGTWKLVSVKARDLDSGEERDAWGPNPTATSTTRRTAA